MIWQSISTLNLFQSRFADEEDLSHQRVTTRVFILLMLIAVIVSGAYIFFSIETQVITISNPSLEIYHQLYGNYSSTLSCPCTQMFIPYKKFLMINYTLHQICSSTLVAPAWLKFILAYNQSVIWSGALDYSIDFRVVAPSYFQLLAIACSLVENTFDNVLNTLEERHYINQYIPSQFEFLAQMSLLNESLTTSAQQEFLTIQNWLHLMTTHNQFLMGLGTNGRLTANTGSDVVEVTERDLGRYGEVTETLFTYTSTCSCRQFPTICQVVPFLDAVNGGQMYPFRFFVGMNVGCIPWAGLLSTNVSWWYRTDIIDQIRLLFDEHPHNQSDSIISPLGNQTETRFRYPNGSHRLFEALFEEALLERWTGNLTRFDLFYQECAPKECTYVIRSERSRLVALLLLVSICGGLNKVLRWFSSLFLRMIFFLGNRYLRRRDQVLGEGNIVGSICQSLLAMNLFRSRSTDLRHVQRERAHTRVYLCFLSVSIVILIAYTSLEERAIIKKINPPSIVPNMSDSDRFTLTVWNVLVVGSLSNTTQSFPS